MRNVSEKFVGKIRTHILCSIIFFSENHHLWDNVEKYGTARSATDDNIMLHRKNAISMSGNEGTNTHTQSEYRILTAFPRHQWLCQHA